MLGGMNSEPIVFQEIEFFHGVTCTWLVERHMPEVAKTIGKVQKRLRVPMWMVNRISLMNTLGYDMYAHQGGLFVSVRA